MSNSPKTKSQKVDLRLPAGMRDELNQYAAKHGRSANAQIVQFIEQGMKGMDASHMTNLLMEIHRSVMDIQAQIANKDR